MTWRWDRRPLTWQGVLHFSRPSAARAKRPFLLVNHMPNPDVPACASAAESWRNVAWKEGGDEVVDISVDIKVPDKPLAPPSKEAQKWLDVGGLEERDLASLLLANDSTPPSEHRSARCGQTRDAC